ncbi:MAG: hypothetical protein ACQEQU_07350 [Spirochaetota bacterium]
MKKYVIPLTALHLIIGLGAVAGGLGAMLDPFEPMGAPQSMLEHSPFETFFIPGVLLFGVIGLGNLAALAVSFLKPQWRGFAGGAAGDALLIWIVVQCIMLRSVVFLHVLFFMLGILQGVLSLLILKKQNQFPFSL